MSPEAILLALYQYKEEKTRIKKEGAKPPPVNNLTLFGLISIRQRSAPVPLLEIGCGEN